MIREVVQSGADLNARMDRTNHRRTAVHLAVVKKQPASLAALIDLGADVNLEDAVGLTPLDQAALDGEDEMTRQLTIKNADAQTVKKAALAAGMRTLREDGAQKVLAGMTTTAEVLMITTQDSN